MTQNTPLADTASHAVDLALLVDLEACWDNLRARSPSRDLRSAQQELTSKQKAYEAFQIKLRAFNKKYTLGYVSDFQRTTPVRLGLWCRKMRSLYREAGHDPRIPCPIHVLERAYRSADAIAARLGKDRFNRSAADTLPAAIQELEALEQWCQDLLTVASELQT